MAKTEPGAWGEDPRFQNIPWWNLEHEIDVFRARLAELPCKNEGIFLTALRMAEHDGSDDFEVSLLTLVTIQDFEAMRSEAIIAVEKAVHDILEAEGVCRVEDAGKGPCHIVPMELFLAEEDRTLMVQLGAEILLVFVPEAGPSGRLLFRIRPLSQAGYDLEGLDHEPEVQDWSLMVSPWRLRLAWARRRGCPAPG